MGNVLAILLVGVVFAGGGYWAGMTYGSAARPAPIPTLQTATTTAGTPIRNPRVDPVPGQFPFGGKILSIQGSTLEVAVPSPALPLIVHFNPTTTPVQKIVEALPSELTTGMSIAIKGEQQADGSVVAELIRIPDNSFE